MERIFLIMANISDIIQKELEQCKSQIAGNFVNQNAQATGKSVKSLEVKKISDTHFQLLGGNWLVFTELGRRGWNEKPENLPPPIKPIAEWVKAKGLTISPWAVVNSIAQNGSLVGVKPRDLYTTIVDDCVERLRDEVINAVVTEAVNEVVLELNKIKRNE